MPNTNKKADKVTSVKTQDYLKKIVNTQLKTKRMINDLSERIDFIEKRLEILDKKNSGGKTKSLKRRTHDV